MKPLPFDPAKKYPMVLRIHGGPAGMYGTNFDHEVHVLSARGYAVLFINPRGSTGYGQTFVRANQKDWAGKDFTDLMKGVDTAHRAQRVDRYPTACRLWLQLRRLHDELDHHADDALFGRSAGMRDERHGDAVGHHRRRAQS